MLPLPPPPLGDPRLPSDSTATGGFAVGVGSAPWAPQWVDRGGGVATAAVPTHLLTHLARNDPASPRARPLRLPPTPAVAAVPIAQANSSPAPAAHCVEALP